MNLEIGAQIGDYQVVDVLGAGGMGKVYKVRNLISDRIEALKVLLPNLENQPELAERFMREIKVQASLDHPNIAALYTAQRFGNQLLMLMEFVEGTTLEQRLRQGRIPLAQGIDYILQVLSALSCAHQLGVIHRDIKPSNVMLTHGEKVKLMDFGIAKAAAVDRKLTMTGTTLGSLYYMSPEQIKGAALDQRTDLYSVGVTLYEVVTGKRPFDGDSQFRIMAAHLETEPVAPLTLDPSLPAALNDVILMSIAKDPDKRFQSADAFRTALGSVKAGLGSTAAMAGPLPAAVGPSSRRGLYITLGALLTAAVVIAFIQFGPRRHTSASGMPPVVLQTPQQVEAPAPKAAEPPTSLPAAAKPAPEPVPLAITPAAKPKPLKTQVNVDHPAPVPTPPSVPDRVLTAELDALRERLVLLASRANAVRTSLQNMQNAQAAAGLSMRQDITAAASHMNYLIDGANSAISAGDAASAKKFLDQAEGEAGKLEKFFGR